MIKDQKEWAAVLRDVSVLPGSPVQIKDGKWHIQNRKNVWKSMGPRISDAHLDRLRAVAVEVLKEKDPQFDLESSERYAAALHGKILKHSRSMREGVAETLALLGTASGSLTSCTRNKPENTAILAVREILKGADAILWASLNDCLPTLAEAAPSEFLDAIEQALQESPSPFSGVFAQESGGFSGRNYTSGLLWGLETLAWSPDYVGRVALILGGLAALDPGGNWANRPTNSLVDIFLPWHPQTCANISKRKAAIEALLREQPTIGWDLLLALLPAHKTTTGTRKPEWREFIPTDWKETVAKREYWEQVSIYAGLAVDISQKDMSKLIQLMGHVASLPPPSGPKLLEHLASDKISALPEVQRLPLWEALTKITIRHRRFPDAEWAMKPEHLEIISTVASKLAPTTPSLKYKRLFDENDFDLFEENGNFTEQQRTLDESRQLAIQEVYKEGGLGAVTSLAKGITTSSTVGFAFGKVAEEKIDQELLPGFLSGQDKGMSSFIGGFIWGRFKAFGWGWVDKIDKSKWTNEQVGQFMSCLPFTSEAWERVSRLLTPDESAYWSKIGAFGYIESKGLEHAIDRLLDYGHPLPALRCIHDLIREKIPVDPKRMAHALLELVKLPKGDLQAMDSYSIQEIIKAFQKHPDTSPDDLFRVEWAYLPALDHRHGVSPKLLETRLATDPKFFSEVIRLVFKSNKEDNPAKEVSEDQRAIAKNAYRLLSEWRTPPGSGQDGSFDPQAFKQWFDAMRAECSESGHLEIAYTMLGHVLIHTPADPDGLWINRVVATELDAINASDMRAGFQTELFNLRGVHWVDPTGKPEKDLAQKYRNQADTLETAGFPRFAGALRGLATSYDREAEQVISEARRED